MSKNAKKQTAKPSPRTSESKTSEPTQPDEQNSTASETNSTPEQSESPAPDGDQPDEQAPQDDENGPQSDEQAQDGSQEGQGDESPADGDQDAPADEQGDEDEHTGPRFASSRREGQPVDANTAGVAWKGLVPESKPDGIILEADEDERFEGEREGNLIRVTRDVFREVYPRGANRPTYVLLYRKGALISGMNAQAVTLS